MNRTSRSGPPASDAPVPAPGGSKRHFDTFENEFFKDGDVASANAAAAEAERFDDLDEGNRRGFAPSRQFVLSVVAASACLAVIGCVALWRGGGQSRQQTATISESLAEPNPPVTGSVAAAGPERAAAPIAAPSLPSASAPLAAEHVAGAPSTVLPAVAPTPTPVPSVLPPAAEPTPAPSAALPAAAPASMPSAAPPAPAAVMAGTRPVAATDPDNKAAKPVVLALDTAAEHPVGAATGDAAIARARCKETARDRRQKDLLSVCSAAFAADPSAADVAVILAKAEFDKGHAAQAMTWSQKALAADPTAADAYVFIGGVEQSAGHKKAAKEAYKRYLQLAPGGRYASDLRAIVGSL